jgi:CMP-N,N'-diacetyllegionaminic acid synthase
MIKSKLKITALLTGRGNNTLKDKNVLPVLGKPLLAYPCEAVKRSAYVTDFWVSSEDEKILKAAADSGFKLIQRPEELALPTAQHVDVIDHAVKTLADINEKPDLLVVLLANSVTVKTDWIDTCIEDILDNENVTASVTVYKELDHHPFRAKKVSRNGFLEPFFNFEGENISTNRQDLEPSFFLSHNFWVLNLDKIDRTTGFKPWSFMGDKVRYFEVEEAFDVHSLEDIARSEEWIKRELL